MANKIILGLPIVAILLFGNVDCCKKAEVVPETDRYALLWDKNWQMSGETTNGTDTYANRAACSKDDFIYFKSDGGFIFNEGAVNCSSSRPPVINMTWLYFTNDKAYISFGLGYYDGISNGQIFELTETSFKIKFLRGTDKNMVFTYKKI
jgi:hypothetical protein